MSDFLIYIEAKIYLLKNGKKITLPLDKRLFIIYIRRVINVREIFLKNILISFKYKYLQQEKD